MERNEQLTLENSKVVSLATWKMNKNELKEAQNFKNYLNSLQSDGLLNEVKFFLRELKSSEDSAVTAIHIKKGKLILDEISSRVSLSSPQMAQAIKEVRKSLTEKLSKLHNLELLQ